MKTSRRAAVEQLEKSLVGTTRQERFLVLIPRLEPQPFLFSRVSKPARDAFAQNFQYPESG